MIEQKVQTDEYIPSGIQSPIQFDIADVEYLAKGIVKNNEVLGRIIKITFEDNVNESVFSQLQNLDSNIEYIQKTNT